MLNRTNLTLSALSNRLNLGTRSLAINAGVNNRGQALTLRPSFHDHHVMRVGTVWDVVRSSLMGDGISPRPGSMIRIPGSQQRSIRCAGTRNVEAAFVGRVGADPEPSEAYRLQGRGWQRSSRHSMKPTAKKTGAKVLKRLPGRKPRSVGEASEGFAASPAKAPRAAAAIAAAATA